ncbi:MAG: putative metal-dependent hydrolase [Ignavibacteriales bacterium]|nr:putative metal-dependent hydrolase [Ignavibacteriales bacterium]
MSDIRYPVGTFDPKLTITDTDRQALINQIAWVPQKLREALRGLSDQRLDVPYREGGWTIRQQVHHLPDSHMNAYIRFKLAVTEENPTIKPYHEQLWAELVDGKLAPPELSLVLMESLHARWAMFLRSMKPEQFARTLIHPQNGPMNLDRVLQLYAWHGRHHVAHITAQRQRMGW